MHFSSMILKLSHVLPNGVREIRPNWKSLCNILPANNRGVDIHEESEPVPDRDQDDLLFLTK